MDRVRHIGSAAALASCAGGPILALVVGIGGLLSGDPVHFDPDAALTIVASAPTIAVIGWFVAIAPNLVGSFVLGWLGRDNVGMRLPPVWAIVGAAAAGIPAWLSAGDYETVMMPAGAAALGAISALICRAKVRWEEEAASAPAASIGLTPARPRATP